MRSIFIILLTTLLFSGCSRKHTAYIDETLDIEAGKEIALPGGDVLSVKKRDGNSLEGIRVVQRGADGREAVITADTGTVVQGPKQRVEVQPADAKTQDGLRVFVIKNSVKLTLFDANREIKTQAGTNKMTFRQMELHF